MFTYPGAFLQCNNTRNNNPFKPTQLRINECEIERIVRKNRYGVKRKPNIGDIYSTSLKRFTTSLEYDDEDAFDELTIKWTTFRSETIDTLLRLNGIAHFNEHYNIIDDEKQFIDEGIFTTVRTKEIRKNRKTHNFKNKLNRIIKGCQQRFKTSFKCAPPLPTRPPPVVITSPSPSLFCVSTLGDEDSGLYSSGFSTPRESYHSNTTTTTTHWP